MSVMDIAFEEAFGFLACQACECRDAGNSRAAMIAVEVNETFLDIGFSRQFRERSVGHAVTQ